MKISRIDHLGIGVQSIEEVLPFFENVLGLKCYAVEEVADQKVHCFPQSWRDKDRVA
jgi:methylmalonyl-CoA/ethylmalonyl-CoA epimerase